MFNQKEYSQQYYSKNKARIQARSKRSRGLNNPIYKEAAINVYTNGEATCRHCGQGDIDVLCLDHIADDGHKERKARQLASFGGVTFYRYLSKRYYPPGLQVLCYNCNMKKEIQRRRAVYGESK